MSDLTPIGAIAGSIVEAARKAANIPKVYADLVSYQISRLLEKGDLIPEAKGLRVDQHQQNSLYCVHQMRVTLPNGMGTYRVIIAPDNAPIEIKGVPADQHFMYPLTEKVVQLKAAE